jgi:hypothetical protein
LATAEFRSKGWLDWRKPFERSDHLKYGGDALEDLEMNLQLVLVVAVGRRIGLKRIANYQTDADRSRQAVDNFPNKWSAARRAV